MSINPTLTISIDRTSLELEPLVYSASDDATGLAIVGYSEPAIQMRVEYAPDSNYVAGSVALSAVAQHTVLNFDLGAKAFASTEASVRLLVAELRAAIQQFAFTATVTVDGAPAETWACDSGSIGAAARDYSDLKAHNEVYPISIPCHPVRTVA